MPGRSRRDSSRAIRARSPLARVVIGGLVSSTVRTLLVLPAICALTRRRTAGDAAMT
jgi:Cu/Ag efflux pump CusA